MATFSWRRGLEHAAIPFGLLVVAGMVVAGTGAAADPERLGQGVGQFGALVALAALGISYLAQTGRRRAAWAAGLGGAALIAAAAAAILLVPARRSPVPLSAAERAPLASVDRDGERRLVHASLGFSILHPGDDVAESAAAAAIMARALEDPATHYYAYADAPPSRFLLIGVFKGAGGSRAALQGLVSGAARGLSRAVREQIGPDLEVRTVREQVRWDGAHRDAELHLAIGDALHVQVRAQVLPDRPGRPPVVVALTSLGEDAGTFTAVLDSLRVE